MGTPLLRVLKASFSEVRLESYRSDGQSDLDLVATYLWNVPLREALHPSLQAVEVALRNTMHSTIQRRHLQQRYPEELWFDHLDYFVPRYDKNRVRLSPKTIEDARRLYRNRGEEASVDQIISSTHLGFWTTMLSPASRPILWVPLGFTMLREMFPHASHGQGGLEFSAYWDAYDSIRRLRNRVSHYEKLSDRRDLVEVHRRIYQCMGWINDDLPTVIASTDRFNEVHALGIEPYRRRITNLDL